MGGDYNIRLANKGALTQARAKLNPWAFIRLNKVACDSFYKDADYLKWKGFRLLAVDGSTLRLPNSEDIRKEFGSHDFGRNANSQASVARCSLLYDVLNNVTLDAQIGKFTVSERELLSKHIPELREKDLLLGDRGYPSNDLFNTLMDMGVEFCIRLKDNWRKSAKALKASDQNDIIVKLKVPPPESTTDNKNKNHSTTLKVRMVKIELEDGKVEILCTSLMDSKKYPIAVFKKLYHMRWQVEEAYKLLKSRIEVESFSGKTAHSVYQDFYAKVLMMSLCAALSFPIEEKVKAEYKKEKTGNKFDQKINKTSALAITRDNLVNIFLKNLKQKSIDVMDHLIESSRELTRPNRKLPRDHKPKKRFHTSYKGY